jgi:hypothetical protein
MKRILSLAAVIGLNGILAGSGAMPAMATPSLCDSIAGNLVVNCGFETGDFSGWTTNFPPGSTFVDMAAAHTGNFGVFDGVVGMDGTLSQTLTILDPGTYEVAAWWFNSGQSPNDFNVTFDGVEGINLVNPPGFPPYEEFSFLVSSTGGPADLVLGFRNDPGFDAFDDISVVEVSSVPEPATLTLLSSGLLGLAMMRRRKLSRAASPLALA